MFEFNKVYNFYKSKNDFSPIILSSPHSGRLYQKEYLDLLNFDLMDLRIFEDCLIDELYEFGPDIGCNFLVSNIPRLMIDLNRGKDEIDKEMFFNLPGDSFCNSNRVLSGIGLFPKLRGSESIYREKLDWLIFKKLIDNVYDVWHSKLEKEIIEVKTTFSDIVLLDCHSMPSLDINGQKIKNLSDFVIGDLWGKTSKKEITQFLVDFLKKEGFKVSTNSPYAGAHILKKYGKPEKGINALQIEIRKDLYLDEKELSINEDYNKIKKILQKMILSLSTLINDKNIYQKSAE